MSDEAGAHGDPEWREREKERFVSDAMRQSTEVSNIKLPPTTGPNPIDTIREALEGSWRPIREDGTYAHSPRYENALAALTEVEHQLAVPESPHTEFLITKVGAFTPEGVENLHARAVAAETALAEAEDGRDALVDEIQREYVLRSTHLAIVGAAERRASALADALREMAYRTAIDGRLCWCSDTYRVHNPDGPHGVRCSIARAALDRQEQT